MGKKETQTVVVLFKWSLLKGGTEKQLLLLYHKLKQEGRPVAIITSKYDADFIGSYSAAQDINIANNFSSVLKRLAFIRKSGALIIHAWDHKSSIFGLMSSLMIGCRFIDGSIRSAPSSNMKHFVSFRRKYFLFSILGVTTVSNSANGLLAYGVEEKKNSYVIYNGINEPATTSDVKAPIDGFTHRVAMVANMRWKKDFGTFIRAALEVVKDYPDTGFYLVGDGENRPGFEKMISTSNYPSNFVITGAVNNPLTYVRAADVCVLTNEVSGEGLSNSIMEYMLCKKPVVATNMGGNSELVINDVTGYLIKEHAYQDLAKLLTILIEDSTLRKDMGEAGYNRVKNEFSVDKMYQSYLDLYKRKGYV